MKNQKITIHTENTVNANGKLNSSSCKPVVCCTNGMVFTSVTDAAKYAGVATPTMCQHLKGKCNTVRGMQYKYLAAVLDNPNSILDQLRTTSAKVDALKADAEDARKWREYQAEQEAIRKAEEKRLEDERKAREAHAAKKAKAEARVKQLQDKCDRISEKLKLNQNKLAEAQKELDGLNAMEVAAA